MPLVRGVQALPLSVVLRIVPLSPTAKLVRPSILSATE